MPSEEFKLSELETHALAAFMLAGLSAVAFAQMLLLPMQARLDQNPFPLSLSLQIYQWIGINHWMPDLILKVPQKLQWMASYAPILALEFIIAAAIINAVVDALTKERRKNLLDEKEEASRHDGIPTPELDHVTPLHRCLPTEFGEIVRLDHMMGIIPTLVAPKSQGSGIEDRADRTGKKRLS